MFTLYLTIYFLILLLALYAIYTITLKPYLTIQNLKKSFQQKGYKIFVQPFNPFKQTIFPRLQKNYHQHNDCFYDYKQNYQNYDLCIQNSFNRVVITFININLIKQIYKKYQNYTKAKLLISNFGRIYGGGLVFSQGAQWKSKRKLYSQIFNFQLLQGLHSHIQIATKQTIKTWKTNTQIDLLKQFRKLFFNIFIYSYFGKQFKEFHYKNLQYSEAIVQLFDKLFEQTFTLRNLLFGIKFLEKGVNQHDKQTEEIMNVIKSQTKEFVLKTIEQIQSQKVQETSILAKLVYNSTFKQMTDEEKNSKIDAIVGDVIIFFFAGTDTTSSTMAATFHLLHKYPKVLEKLQEELEKTHEDYSPSTIKNLKYMDAVFNETLRLYGPANQLLPRIVTSDKLTVDQIHLPKNLLLNIQNYTNHHSQKYYQKPTQFKPQRWLDKTTQIPFSFVPFSSGPRNCIGQHLSRVQYKIALSMILRKFKFRTNQTMAFHTQLIYVSANNKFILQSKQQK